MGWPFASPLSGITDASLAWIGAGISFVCVPLRYAGSRHPFSLLSGRARVVFSTLRLSAPRNYKHLVFVVLTHDPVSHQVARGVFSSTYPSFPGRVGISTSPPRNTLLPPCLPTDLHFEFRVRSLR